MIRDGHSNEGTPDNQNNGCGVCDWMKSTWAGAVRAYRYAMRFLLFKLVLAFIIPQIVIWGMYQFYMGEYHPDEAAVFLLLVISTISAAITAAVHHDSNKYR